jgi:hypothetical protein
MLVLEIHGLGWWSHSAGTLWEELEIELIVRGSQVIRGIRLNLYIQKHPENPKILEFFSSVCKIIMRLKQG